MQIYFLYKGGNSKPPMQYLASAGKVHARDLLPLRYDSVLAKKRLPAGLYIFSDIEFLRGELRDRVVALYDRLSGDPSSYRTFNNPHRTFTRYPLLRKLHEDGINDFNVYRASDDLSDVRFPAFLRVADDHSGPRTGLLPDQAALQDVLAKVTAAAIDLRRLLVTEFCQTAGVDGLYRKYSSVVFGGSVVARHMLTGSDWMLKVPEKSIGSGTLAEELDFLRTNRFAGQLAEVCAVAGVDYGRVDFGLREGRIQVWEINTNPMLLRVQEMGTDPRASVHEAFFKAYRKLVDGVLEEPPHQRPGAEFLSDRMERMVRVLHESCRETPLGRFWERHQKRIKNFGREPSSWFPKLD